VQAFVARYEFVAEGKSGHDASLLEPEDGAEGSAEEDAFHGCESHQSGREAVSTVDLLEGPVSLLLDGREVFDCVEQL